MDCWRLALRRIGWSNASGRLQGRSHHYRLYSMTHGGPCALLLRMHVGRMHASSVLDILSVGMKESKEKMITLDLPVSSWPAYQTDIFSSSCCAIAPSRLFCCRVSRRVVRRRGFWLRSHIKQTNTTNTPSRDFLAIGDSPPFPCFVCLFVPSVTNYTKASVLTPWSKTFEDVL